jgi:type II secretory pathway component GspD/PulD (secretin)
MNSAVAVTVAAAVSVLVLSGCSTRPPAKTQKNTYSSFDLQSEHQSEDGESRRTCEAQDLPITDVLKIYERVSGRMVIAGRLPSARISFRSGTPLTRIEALQMMDTVLAQNGIAMVLSGEDAVKAVPAASVRTESPPEITLPWRLLPESSSPMSRTVHLSHLKPSETVPVLMPFANLPNSILPIDSQRILVLRDYSSNIRQQLKLLEELDQEKSGSGPN